MESFRIGAVERVKKSREGMLYSGHQTTSTSLKGRPGISSCSMGNSAATRVKLGRHVDANAMSLESDIPSATSIRLG